MEMVEAGVFPYREMVSCLEWEELLVSVGYCRYEDPETAIQQAYDSIVFKDYLLHLQSLMIFCITGNDSIEISNECENVFWKYLNTTDIKRYYCNSKFLSRENVIIVLATSLLREKSVKSYLRYINTYSSVQKWRHLKNE